jgi:hypothetical protein
VDAVAHVSHLVHRLCSRSELHYRGRRLVFARMEVEERMMIPTDSTSRSAGIAGGLSLAELVANEALRFLDHRSSFVA